MKSIFTKLSTLLLCGVVALVGCTDFSEDIQAVDKKVDDLTASTQTELASLKSAITDLEAKLAAQYATKDEVAALKTALENSIASEVDALSKDIADVNAALKAAEDKINGAIADLDDKKADKTAVDAAIKTATEAIAALQSQLEAAKGELEAEIDEVKAEIAATEEELAAQIGAVDAKANELQNTLLALSDYLANLEAKVNELKGTLDALSEYLPKMKAELEEKINAVDAKAIENYNTLLALSDHLAEYEATTDFKLVELQGSLAALSVYLEEYEASVDAKFKEILNTFDSLDGFLDEKFATLDATDTDLYNEINGIREAFTTLNNLLEDEVKARQEADEALYTKISEEVALQIEAMQEYYTQLYNRVVDLEAADDAIYVEMENIRTYVAQVYNSLSYEIKAVDAALKAHIAAFEAFKAAYEEKVAELEATDTDLYGEINGLREVITTINNHIDDLRAEDEAIYLEINGLRENLTQLQNAINNRIDEEVKDLKADILDKFNILNTVILETEKRVNDKFMHTLELISDLDERIVANAAAIAELEAAIKALNEWVEAHGENYDELVQFITEQFTAINEDLEDLQAEDGAIYDFIGKTATNLNNLIEDANRTIQGLKDLCSDQQNQIGANKDAIYALQSLLAKLEADLDARLDTLENRVDNIEIDIEALEKALADLETALENGLAETLYLAYKNDEGVMGNVKAFEDKVSALVEELRNADGKIREDFAAELADILVRLASIDTELAEIAEWQTSVNTTLGQLSSQIYEAIGLAETQLKKDIEEAVSMLKAEDAKIREEIKAGLAEIYRLAILNDDGVMGNVRAFEEKVSNIVAELRGQLGSLMSRVQSLVYVPEYADHKATIEYAVISQYEMDNDRPAEAYAEGEDGKQLPYTYVAKASDLKYLVKADNAAEVAEAIAKNWASVLDYEVKDVKTTRAASETGADLEIVKVEAKGEYIIVSVVAKNFDAKFFQKRKIGGIYSAALVLADENNTRTTEYTNLVPGTPVNYVARVLDGKDEDITFRSYEDAPVAYLPYDRDPAERIILEGHRLAFTAGEEIKTADQLISEGYDIQLERRVYQKQLNTSEVQDHIIVLKKGEVERRQVGHFELREDPLASITKENDTYVKIREEMSKETYKALKAEGQHILTIDYRYNVNGLNVNTEASAEICNRLVEVNMETIVPWTLETALSTIADSKMYEGPVTATFEYDLAKAANKPLEGYSLHAIVTTANEQDGTSYVPKCPITMSISDETITATLKHGSKARYSFPENNNDDVVDYNSYTVTKKAEYDDLTVTVNVTLKLGEQAPHQYLKKDVKFTTEAGANGWLFGYWNALEDAYQKFLADGYIGYVDAPETGKAKFFEAFAQTSSYGNMGAMPVVNGETGIPQNVNIPFTANNNEAGEHKFQLWHEQLGLTPEQPYVDGTKHTILQSVKPYFQIPFTFTVNGTVDLPDYALDLDPVRVLNRGNEKIVNVYGEISKETNKYTVDVSDLAKYYYVVNKEGTKSLVNANNDVVTVDFTLSPMAGAEETGYNFNAVADDTDYTLTVDWTKAEPYILPMSEAVVNWGTYPHTEVGVNAILNVNGFPIVAKPITLVTADPLEIALNDVTVEVTHLSGTNAEPIVAKVYQNFVLTSAVEEGNLFNNNAKTIGGLWYYSKADNTYGVTMDLKFNRVYYKKNNEKVGWDESKIVLEKYTAENVVAPYEVGDLTGNVWIRPDDGDIRVPIYVEFEVVMTHRIHDASKTTCETKGTVTVKFVPEGWDK